MPAKATLALAITPAHLFLQERAARDYVAYPTLRAWVAEECLPAAKIGGRFPVPIEDFETLLTRKVQTSAARPNDEVEAAVARVVDAAPRLTDVQREQLAVILGRAS